MTRSCATLDLAALDATRATVEADQHAGQGSFKSVTEWVNGARAKTTARSFAIETDEPSALGGTDQAVDPMELVLAAVGTCLTIGWVTHAAKRDVDFRELRIEVEGDYDLRGYLGIDETRPGFASLRYRVHVNTDASDSALEDIRTAAETGSPVVDNVVNATPLQGTVERG